MIFVFGGAYQGMEAYAKDVLHVNKIEIATEADTELNFQASAISGIENFVLGCVRRGESACDYFKAHEAEFQNCVLIGLDLSCGVVPMDPLLRAWRDENGRVNNQLAVKADRVIRMFCFIADELK